MKIDADVTGLFAYESLFAMRNLLTRPNEPTTLNKIEFNNN